MKCPHCKGTKYYKDGKNHSGTQIHRCKECKKRYTPNPKAHGYSEETRLKALKLYLEGMSFRGVGRILGVHYQSVANWVKAHAENLSDPEMPNTPENAELDELFTYVTQKKRKSTF